MFIQKRENELDREPRIRNPSLGAVRSLGSNATLEALRDQAQEQKRNTETMAGLAELLPKVSYDKLHHGFNFRTNQTRQAVAIQTSVLWVWSHGGKFGDVFSYPYYMVGYRRESHKNDKNIPSAQILLLPAMSHPETGMEKNVYMSSLDVHDKEAVEMSRHLSDMASRDIDSTTLEALFDGGGGTEDIVITDSSPGSLNLGPPALFGASLAFKQRSGFTSTDGRPRLSTFTNGLSVEDYNQFNVEERIKELYGRFSVTQVMDPHAAARAIVYEAEHRVLKSPASQ